MKKLLLTAAALISLAAQAQTGAYNEQATAYIRKYKDMAIAEQRRSGVPAAITLAQGIYETQAGQSELATEANNHFGIKCKKEWTGETYAHTDDAPNECFRKYSNAGDSYRDHSDYLRQSPRYASCFALDVTDYAGWASELKRCGYATNPRYAAKLMRVVEDFHLQDYTNEALRAPGNDAPLIASAEPLRAQTAGTGTTPAVQQTTENIPAAGENVPAQEATPAREEIRAEVAAPAATQEVIEPETAPVYGQQLQRYGLKGFYARKGDVMLEYAIKYNLRYARLLELNDLPDAPLPADMFIYLEKKRGAGMHSTHKVQAGETMLGIAQAEGIQLKQLRTLNQMEAGEEPNPGTALQLQTMAAVKPGVSAMAANPAPQPQYQATITPPASSAPAIAGNTAAATPVATAAPLLAKNTAVAPATEVPAPAAEEEETEEEEVRNKLPDVPQRNAAPVTAKAETPAIREQTPPAPAPVAPKEPEKKPVPAPRPQPRPATPPREKTYTIADEMAVGEENPANVKYSPRYVPPKTETPKTETTVTPPANTNTNTAPKAAEPQDEFSRLKAQLDKAVYAPRKPATMVVAEEGPEALRGRTPTTTSAPSNATPQVAAGSTGIHTVKNGETAFSIAKQYGMSMKELRELNNLNFEAIRVGQKLKVKAN